MTRAAHKLLAMTWLLVACLGCSDFGFGKVVPPPKRPAPRVAPEPAQTSDPLPTAPPEPRAPFSLLWSQQTKPDSRGLALSSSGRLAVLASRELALLDAKSGAFVVERPACTTFAGAVGFVSEDVIAVICEREVRLFAAADLSDRGVRSLPSASRLAAFAPGVVALAFDEGPVRIYDTDAWSEQKAIDLKAPARALALSGDGAQLAIGLDGGVILRALDDVTPPKRLDMQATLPVLALSLSRDAAKLAAASGPHAAAWQLASRQIAQRFVGVSGVSETRWLGEDEIATSGRDGLVLFDLRGGSGGVGGVEGTDAPVSLAVAPVGGSRGAWWLCAAGADGLVSCYGRGVNVVGVPWTAAVATDARRASGTIVAVSAKKLEVRPHDPQFFGPAVGARVTLARYSETTVGTARNARWVEVADAHVLAQHEDQGVVELEIEGTPRNAEGIADPLALGTFVKLVWHP